MPHMTGVADRSAACQNCVRMRAQFWVLGMRAIEERARGELERMIIMANIMVMFRISSVRYEHFSGDDCVRIFLGKTSSERAWLWIGCTIL